MTYAQNCDMEAQQTRKVSTRDAVETAIDVAKENKTGTWEDGVRQMPNKITSWSSNERSNGKSKNKDGES